MPGILDLVDTVRVELIITSIRHILSLSIHQSITVTCCLCQRAVCADAHHSVVMGKVRSKCLSKIKR